LTGSACCFAAILARGVSRWDDRYVRAGAVP
jgi:hypothetical protein